MADFIDQLSYFFCCTLKLAADFNFRLHLIAGETIILTSELMVGFADFLLFCFGHIFFRLVLFQLREIL